MLLPHSTSPLRRKRERARQHAAAPSTAASPANLAEAQARAAGAPSAQLEQASEELAKASSGPDGGEAEAYAAALKPHLFGSLALLRAPVAATPAGQSGATGAASLAAAMAAAMVAALDWPGSPDQFIEQALSAISTRWEQS
jgi:hypothetical protein